MLNRVVLVGRLTKDPELRRTQSGAAVTTFTLAVDKRFSRDQDRTANFFTIVAWNNTAENVAKYMRKGNLVGVDGRLDQRSYERADKTRGYVVEVIADQVSFLEPKGTTNDNTQTTSYEEERAVEEDLPF
jgi:single-strand DNA-binding protein